MGTSWTDFDASVNIGGKLDQFAFHVDARDYPDGSELHVHKNWENLAKEIEEACLNTS